MTSLQSLSMSFKHGIVTLADRKVELRTAANSSIPSGTLVRLSLEEPRDSFEFVSSSAGLDEHLREKTLGIWNDQQKGSRPKDGFIQADEVKMLSDFEGLAEKHPVARTGGHEHFTRVTTALSLEPKVASKTYLQEDVVYFFGK